MYKKPETDREKQIPDKTYTLGLRLGYFLNEVKYQ